MEKQPTEAEIKEFWEWCGFKLKEVKFGMSGIVPQWLLQDYADWELPKIDLNNLFKYAVPKLSYLFLDGFWNGNEGCFNYAATIGAPEGEYKKHEYYKDPALALFWAIWEVIHG